MCHKQTCCGWQPPDDHAQHLAVRQASSKVRYHIEELPSPSGVPMANGLSTTTERPTMELSPRSSPSPSMRRCHVLSTVTMLSLRASSAQFPRACSRSGAFSYPPGGVIGRTDQHAG